MTPQANFMVLAAIDPAREAELRRLLDSMNDAPGRVNPDNELVPFAQFDTLHFARLVILDDKTIQDVRVYGIPTRTYPLYLAFLGDIDGEYQQTLQLERPPLDAVLQGVAFEELHCDIGSAVLVANVVEDADVRVIQSGSSPSLLLKTAGSSRVVSDVVVQEFERDKAAEADVFGLVNHTHAAAAQFLQDAVVGNGLAEHAGGMLWASLRQVK